MCLLKCKICGWLICGEWKLADVVVKEEGVTEQLESDDWLQKTNIICVSCNGAVKEKQSYPIALKCQWRYFEKIKIGD